MFVRLSYSRRPPCPAPPTGNAAAGLLRGEGMRSVVGSARGSATDGCGRERRQASPRTAEPAFGRRIGRRKCVGLRHSHAKESSHAKALAIKEMAVVVTRARSNNSARMQRFFRRGSGHRLRRGMPGVTLRAGNPVRPFRTGDQAAGAKKVGGRGVRPARFARAAAAGRRVPTRSRHPNRTHRSSPRPRNAAAWPRRLP